MFSQINNFQGWRGHSALNYTGIQSCINFKHILCWFKSLGTIIKYLLIG